MPIYCLLENVSVELCTVNQLRKISLVIRSHNITVEWILKSTQQVNYEHVTVLVQIIFLAKFHNLLCFAFWGILEYRINFCSIEEKWKNPFDDIHTLFGNNGQCQRFVENDI